MFVAGPGPYQRFVEIQDRAGRKRVKRAAQVRHRRREDGRDYQTGDAVRQSLHDEDWKNFIVAG